MDKKLLRPHTPLLLCATMLFCASALAEGSGIVAGQVTDAADGSPLWGANVLVVGTSIGTVTDDAGKFRILEVQPGVRRLAIRYLGYETVEKEVTVSDGQAVEINVALRSSLLEQKEVVVTGQLKGQQAAINQQLSSNSIVNVVSQDRIRELPDQNAAEAISRLPGISVQRDGGEASKVVVRGLSPKYTNITINGEKIPSTDLEDRSVDLSSISSDMLVGIEVYKSPTADKDGDAVGGTVNFAMKKAPDEPSLDMRFEGGNNSLEKTYGDYKGSLNVSNRYLDDALGVVLTGSVQRANRSSDSQQEDYSLAYEPVAGSAIPFQIDDMRLVDRKEIRDRYGASMAMDYDLGLNNSLSLTGFWSKTARDETRRRQRFNVQESRAEYDYLDHNIATQLLSLGLSGDHTVSLPVVGSLDLNWRAAGSMSDQNNPFEMYGRFFQMGLPGVVATQGPEGVPASVMLDPANTWLKMVQFNSERVVDRSYTLQLDAKRDYSFGSDVSGYLKFGGKYAGKKRERDRSQVIAGTAIETMLGRDIYSNPSAFYRSFDLTDDVAHKVLMSSFLASQDDIGEFLQGRYQTWPTLDGQSLHAFWDHLRYYRTSNNLALFDNAQSATDDQSAADDSYRAGEDILAGYAMTEINLGRSIMILPGIRYERTRNDYKTIMGITGTGTQDDDTPNIVAVQDSSGEAVHANWLPMIQARVMLAEGLSLRASAAKTMSRPNYFDLVPHQTVSYTGSPKTIDKGNPSLKYTEALNYDLYLSLFNRYGLFSVGGFYKKLDDVSYLRTSYILSGIYKGFQLTQPVNAADPSYVYGGEVEVQANLTLLPEPFDGILVAGNISIMKSRTLYPRFLVTNRAISTPPFVAVSVLDTVREAPMPGQADMMGNLTVGYQRGGFSGRISLVFQGKSLAIVGTREETDGYTDAYYRWDLAMQQKLFAGISLYLNINNLTAAPDRSSNARFITSEQYYGWSAQVGIRYKI